MKIKHIIALLSILPLIGACDQSDDVIAIFAQGQWKLTYIYEDNSKGKDICVDYWANDKEALNAYEEAHKKTNSYVVTFTGVEIDGEIGGTYSGRASENNISGNWTADGKSNAFSVSNQNEPTSEDILGRVMIRALKNAYKYDGDTGGNLRIFFRDPDKNNSKRFLRFNLLN